MAAIGENEDYNVEDFLGSAANILQGDLGASGELEFRVVYQQAGPRSPAIVSALDLETGECWLVALRNHPQSHALVPDFYKLVSGGFLIGHGEAANHEYH